MDRTKNGEPSDPHGPTTPQDTHGPQNGVESRGPSLSKPPPSSTQPGRMGAGGGGTAQVPRYRSLSPGERTTLARSVGAVSDEEESQAVHRTHWWWPPRGTRPGLYRSVMYERTTWFIYYHLASSARWILMLFHIFVGATLAALGQRSSRTGTQITILAAVNTILAGLLALIHNSGLPDRYSHNMAEFEEVEDHIRTLLETGLVPADLSIQQVVVDCFNRFQDAKGAVRANIPSIYNSKATLRSLMPRRQSDEGAEIVGASTEWPIPIKPGPAGSRRNL